MSIKFRAMVSSDYTALGGEVKSSFSKNTFDALSASLTSAHVFGKRPDSSDVRKSASRDNMRAYISLCKPVVNQLLARDKASLLAKILGLNKDEAEAIAAFRTLYSTATGEYINATAVRTSKDLMCGAEIFMMLIDKFNIKKAIEEEYHKIFMERRYSVEGTFSEKRGALPLAGGWFYNPEVRDPDKEEEVREYLIKEVFKSNESRLTFLLNMSDKSNLYGMLMSHVAVLPIGMRPDIGSRHDPLSLMYSDIISANNNLKLVCNRDYSAQEYITLYKQLDTAVNMLIWKLNPRKKKYKPVTEKLAGKTGFIREKMLGKRTDYSGRSVITIDPFLGIRQIRVPKAMAPKLYRYHILKSMSNPKLSSVLGFENNKACCDILEKKGIMDNVPVVIGRQPTLHKLSMQAYEAQLTDERSIQVNPLMCPAFNADFDGDQMWCRVPCSPEAVNEVRNLMLTTQNIFLPKNGECTLVPRQEMIYGLNTCTRDTYKIGAPVKNYTNLADVVTDVVNQDIKVHQTATYNGKPEIVGKLAVRACLPKSLQDFEIVEITKKTIGKYIEALLQCGTAMFEQSVDKLVALSFRVAYIYPPTLDVLGAPSLGDIFTEFHEEMEESTRWYERGFEEEEIYNMHYDEKFSDVQKKVEGKIYSTLGEENGFVRLAASGARGSKSNLVQMYAYKGRVQKSATETFKAVIEHSYIDQLLPLEHFITAYGGRDGLIAKSLNTADTGYAMRQMWHAANNYVIKSNDCGTKHGLTISKSDLAMFINDPEEINRVFKTIIRGRYLAGSNAYVTKEVAESICKTSDKVEIRSPITCQDPCCRKCYGDDLSTNRDAVVGLPIGFIAAHSIGEPGTQLSMDSFKKGGIANDGAVVSAFTKMEAYVNVRDLRSNPNFNSYDPVAWATGPVTETLNADGTKRISIEGSRKHMNLPAEAIIKTEAVQGEGLCVERGDYDINELVEYAGVEAAQRYLVLMLYSIYKDESEVSMKHFEVLVASMTMHMVVNTDRYDLKVGQYHDSVHLHAGNLDNTEYYTTIKGIKTVQKLRPLAVSSIIMEEVRNGLSRAVMLELEDGLEYPLQRIALGMSAKAGTYYPNFMENRRI